MEKEKVLRFGGSVWCNLDVALRNVNQVFRQSIRSIGLEDPDQKLTVIEWYILRALFEKDGQHASELADAVGRAATSFTPNLDKLQGKGLIERRPDAKDRRAVRIFLTEAAEERRDEVLDLARDLDHRISSEFSQVEFQHFLDVLASMQELKLKD